LLVGGCLVASGGWSGYVVCGGVLEVSFGGGGKNGLEASLICLLFMKRAIEI